MRLENGVFADTSLMTSASSVLTDGSRRFSADVVGALPCDRALVQETFQSRGDDFMLSLG